MRDRRPNRDHYPYFLKICLRDLPAMFGLPAQREREALSERLEQNRIKWLTRKSGTAT